VRLSILPLGPSGGEHRPGFAAEDVRVACLDKARQAVALQTLRSGGFEEPRVPSGNEQLEEITFVWPLLEVATQFVARSDESDDLIHNSSNDVAEHPKTSFPRPALLNLLRS